MTNDEFTLNQIQDLLGTLDARLRQRGIAAAVYIVGGAAVALTGVSAERRTADVDALIEPESDVLEAAREIAGERGLRPNWLNGSVRPWVPSPATRLEPPTQPGLRITTAPLTDLLAMKIVAARGSRDMRDIIPLCAAVELSSAAGLYDLVIAAYGIDAIEGVHGGTADLEAHCRAIASVLADRSP